jgi:hypothetical protein
MVSPQAPYGLTTDTHGLTHETVKCFLGPFPQRSKAFRKHDASVMLALGHRYMTVSSTFHLGCPNDCATTSGERTDEPKDA